MFFTFWGLNILRKEKIERGYIDFNIDEPTVVVDESGKANGRGAYLKKSAEVIEKAKKSKILDKILDFIKLVFLLAFFRG